VSSCCVPQYRGAHGVHVTGTGKAKEVPGWRLLSILYFPRSSELFIGADGSAMVLIRIVGIKYVRDYRLASRVLP